MGWFDEKENSTGSLATRLSTDAASVQGMLGHDRSCIEKLTDCRSQTWKSVNDFGKLYCRPFHSVLYVAVLWEPP